MGEIKLIYCTSIKLQERKIFRQLNLLIADIKEPTNEAPHAYIPSLPAVKYQYNPIVEPPLNLPHKGRLSAPSLEGAENFKCSLLAPKESSEARAGERLLFDSLTL